VIVLIEREGPSLAYDNLTTGVDGNAEGRGGARHTREVIGIVDICC
jgi:hypothetical protein